MNEGNNGFDPVAFRKVQEKSQQLHDMFKEMEGLNKELEKFNAAAEAGAEADFPEVVKYMAKIVRLQKLMASSQLLLKELGENALDE